LGGISRRGLRKAGAKERLFKNLFYISDFNKEEKDYEAVKKMH
jgi:hypothetical protein